MSSMQLFVASGLFTLGVWGGGGFDKEATFSYKDLLHGTPAFTQVHNEVMAYDFLRVRTIGSELEIDNPVLNSKLSHIGHRLDKILTNMTKEEPWHYDVAINKIRETAKQEVLDGKWSQEGLEAYAEAALELDRGIAEMGQTAIETIKFERDESLRDADRMAAITLGYSLGHIYHAWEGDLDDGIRSICETYTNEFADLTPQLERVMETGQGIAVTASFVSDPFDLPAKDNADHSRNHDAPDLQGDL
jgi:hypothetical protein